VGAVISMISTGSSPLQTVRSVLLMTPAVYISFSARDIDVRTGVNGHNGSVASTVIVAEVDGRTTFGMVTVNVVLVTNDVQVAIPLTL